jgi:RNA polymerase sigma-70 factor, ECF subfamily
MGLAPFVTSTGRGETASACAYEDRRSDICLVEAVQHGDRSAFDELCIRNRQVILRMAMRVTRHREDAEDAVQDTLLRAFVGLKRFDRRSSFTTWLARIATNSSLMVLRKRRVAREVFFLEEASNDGDGPHWEIKDQAPDPEKSLALREERALLHEAIRELPPSLRTALELDQLRGLPMQAAAHSLGITTSAMKSRLSRGRSALQKQFKWKKIVPQNRAISQLKGALRCLNENKTGRQLAQLRSKGQNQHVEQHIPKATRTAPGEERR